MALYKFHIIIIIIMRDP